LRLRVTRLGERLVRLAFARREQYLLAFDFTRLDSRGRHLLLGSLLRDVRVLRR
jgi:hypothetical protein